VLTIEACAFPAHSKDAIIIGGIIVRNFYAQELKGCHAAGSVVDRTSCFLAAFTIIFGTVVVLDSSSYASPLKSGASADVVCLSLASSTRRNSQCHFRRACVVQQVELSPTCSKVHGCCVIVVVKVCKLNECVSDCTVNNKTTMFVHRD
jgi:hypothetical protein